MSFILIENPTTIPSETSHLRKDYWEVSDFNFDTNTKSYIVTDGNMKEISNETAHSFVNTGMYPGRAVNPTKVISREFHNLDDIKVIGTTVIGMAVVGGLLALSGK